MSALRRSTKASQLRQYLLKEMTECRIPIGAQLPTETQLMERFSMSRGTVNRVLADLSSRGLVYRQQGKGTFRADPAKALEPSGRTMLIGVWFNVPTGPFYAPIADGIRKELARWGYHAVFEDGGVETGAEHRGIYDLVHKRLDGFIVAPSTNPYDDHSALGELIDRSVPLVLVDQLLPGRAADLVTTNNELGAEEIVQHLVDLGHRRIGFVGIVGLSTMQDRQEAYRFKMQGHGLKIDEAWVQVTENTAFDYGREAAKKILSLPSERRPTALFGANDAIAQTIGMVAREQGLRIPEDLSIAGFDNINVAAFRHIKIEADHAVQLTTYAQPKERIGQQAARLLMRRIQDPSRRHVTVILEGKLVERASTAPPPDSANGEADVATINTKGSGP